MIFISVIWFVFCSFILYYFHSHNFVVFYLICATHLSVESSQDTDEVTSEASHQITANTRKLPLKKMLDKDGKSHDLIFSCRLELLVSFVHFDFVL